MANKRARDSSIRINFRLNPDRPKERVILEFLRKYSEHYEASRIIKQALYDMATGKTWISVPTAALPDTEEESEVQTQPDRRASEVLDEISAGLGDWLQ
jgi:hypothetical protein